MLSISLRRWLRVENGAKLVFWIVVYAHWGSGWPLFAVAFLLPDLSMLGYLANSKVGAVCYNTAHSYAAPALLGLLSFIHMRYSLAAALIWSAHIALDRALGYGLKDASSFNLTHLGVIGRNRKGGHTEDLL